MIYLNLILEFTGLVLIIAYVFARLQVHPHRQKIAKTPKDYGMDYEDIEFKTKDDINIRGWLISPIHKSKIINHKLIIQTHPLPFYRGGFEVKNQGFIKLFKPDVDLLKTTYELHKAGYWVLTFDFRNCGASGDGVTAVGLNEWQDIVGAMDYVAKHKELKAMEIGFASFCMGANSTIIALSKAPEKFKNVKCAMLVQPISTPVFLRSFVKNIFTFLSLPVIPIMEFFARLMGSPQFAEISPIKYAKDVMIPTLLIQGKYDKWTQLSDTYNIYNNLPKPKELYLIDKVIPRFEVYNLVGQKPAKMLEFFKKYL